MDGLMSWGQNLIVWLQSLGDWTIKPMEFFSFLGSEEFYLLIAPAILWCWNASLGLRLGLFLMANSCVNGIIKMILHAPRPYWVDTRVHAFATETSFGIPSGHSQNAVIVWGSLAAHIGKRIGWVIAILIIFFIGFSRLVLGMHYPHDVFAGWLLGSLMLWLFSAISQPVVNWLKKQNIYEQLLAALAGSLLLVLLGLITERSQANFYLPTFWIENTTAAHPDVPISPFALSGIISGAGTFFGLALGAILLERSGGFSTRGKISQKLVRYLVGVLGVFILWFGLGEVFPRGEEVLPYILRYLRYALVGSWVSGLAPYVFRKLRLAEGGH